jgi:hypothetical protein
LKEQEELIASERRMRITELRLKRAAPTQGQQNQDQMTGFDMKNLNINNNPMFLK